MSNGGAIGLALTLANDEIEILVPSQNESPGGSFQVAGTSGSSVATVYLRILDKDGTNVVINVGQDYLTTNPASGYWTIDFIAGTNYTLVAGNNPHMIIASNSAAFNNSTSVSNINILTGTPPIEVTLIQP
ncbi:MAG: hypothetical protein R3B84_09955 [Zavarzinella sp.]